MRTLGIAQASLALLSLNCKFQHDIWRHLLFILSFWGSQFNTFVYGKVGATYAFSQGDTCHRNVIHVSRKIFTFSFSMQNAVGKLAKLSCENIFFQLENFYFPVGKLFFSSWALFFGLLGSFLNKFNRFFFILTSCYRIEIMVNIFDIMR